MTSTPAANRQTIQIFQLWEHLQDIITRSLAPENCPDARISHARELI